MVLKIKELNTRCLLLDLTKGIYEIKIQETISKTEFGQYLHTYTEEEVLETYDSCDYSLSEVNEKLEDIYKLLKS